MLTIDIKVNIKSLDQIKDVLSDPKTLFYFAKEARDRMNRYVPMAEGILSGSAIITPENTIKYTVPYASKMYYGVDFNFSKEQHALATAKWDEAMMLTDKEILADTVGDYIKHKLAQEAK